MPFIVLETLATNVLSVLFDKLNAEILIVNGLHALDDAKLLVINPDYVASPADSVVFWAFQDQGNLISFPENEIPRVRVDAYEQKEDEPQKPWDTQVNRFTYQLGPVVEVSVWVKDIDRSRITVKLARTLEAIGRVLQDNAIALGYPTGRLLRQNTIIEDVVRASSETFRADEDLWIQKGRILFLYRYWLSTVGEHQRAVLGATNLFGEPIRTWNTITSSIQVQIVPDVDVRMVDPYRRYEGIKFLLYAEMVTPAKQGDRFVVDGQYYYVQTVVHPNFADPLYEMAVQNYAAWPEEDIIVLRPIGYTGGDLERAEPVIPYFSAEPHRAIINRQSTKEDIDAAENLVDQDLFLSVRVDEAVLRPEDLIVWDADAYSARGSVLGLITGSTLVSGNIWEIVGRRQPVHLGSVDVSGYIIRRRYD